MKQRDSNRALQETKKDAYSRLARYEYYFLRRKFSEIPVCESSGEREICETKPFYGKQLIIFYTPIVEKARRSDMIGGRGISKKFHVRNFEGKNVPVSGVKSGFLNSFTSFTF